MIIEVRHKGNFKNTERFLHKATKFSVDAILNKYGRLGVQALASNTPVDTGKTAASWCYSIEKGSTYASIDFYNTNVNKGVNIAIILQYGHGTGTGGWVEGRDYINPALQQIFDALAEDAWDEIVRR